MTTVMSVVTHLTTPPSTEPATVQAHGADWLILIPSPAATCRRTCLLFLHVCWLGCLLPAGH
jgi:hypothetical protein